MDINNLRMGALGADALPVFDGYDVPVDLEDGKLVVTARPSDTTRMRMVRTPRHLVDESRDGWPIKP